MDDMPALVSGKNYLHAHIISSLIDAIRKMLLWVYHCITQRRRRESPPQLSPHLFYPNFRVFNGSHRRHLAWIQDTIALNTMASLESISIWLHSEKSIFMRSYRVQVRCITTSNVHESSKITMCLIFAPAKYI